MQLVIGIGNTLRGDDGVGVAVAQSLAEQHSAPDLQVIACQQLTPELAALISQAEQVIFVDASLNLPVGKVQVQPLDAAAEQACSAHHTAPSALLGLAKALYGAQPRSALVAIGAQAFGFSEQLSAPVAQALPQALHLVMGLLSEHSDEVP
ncbi:MAG: hypothetical protein CUN49_10210 [Candidatus Thermofonsia Clade 1 bacterium]|jgi:hydrogenase maturation protease|uniref:Hydrogenase maturation protease n=1 Tax=Candidatus Thermofonsia Clade 1 bacterium TaxID=2364210 RepID=A0A2M8Q069_9CHLR|nr:MAG: hypothetical protein CUN49_10210 [Candidatus Thermofonsia Clade 1 bacterium]PJF43211.1 MAG: hypothetical protein CUN50_01340 [Candidatus Thermofonsia Clade 1 bacterium]RMF50604.1 MAG: hydrogenase maturation protease [Chloroflexota bacterium]